MTSRKLQINVESTHYQNYEYRDAAGPCTSAYLLKQLAAFCGDLRPGTRVLDVGSGNGFLAGSFLNRGCRFVGIDLSTAGVEIARLTYPEGRFEVLSAI